LYASSAYGCIDTSCSLFKIEDAESLYVPNAFTPNGDEVNDRFRVESIGILEMHVDIFNRWGVLIYQYETPQGSWDGRTNNVPSPSDVYVYKIKAKGLVHSDIELMGKVTLVR
jgi:gliding motility-associated-like protein